MKIDFAYTFYDVKEAMKPADRFAPRLLRSLIGWCVFAAMGMLFFFVEHATRAAGAGGGPTPALPPPQDVLVTMLIPMIPVVGILLPVSYGLIFGNKSATATSEVKKPLRMRILPILMWVFLAAVFLMVLDENLVMYWHPTRYELLAIGVVPWIMTIKFAGWADRRLKVRQLWQKQWIHRPAVAEFTASGVTIRDPIFERTHHWAHFVRVKETPNLMLLHTVDENFEIIPKRAFSSEVGLTEFRAILNTNISRCEFAVVPTGFPIEPVARPVEIIV